MYLLEPVASVGDDSDASGAHTAHGYVLCAPHASEHRSQISDAFALVQLQVHFLFVHAKG